MNIERKALIFEKAEIHWGREAQKICAIEELSELINEISKGLNGKNKRGEDGLIDEIADVKIMIAQIEYMHTIEGRVMDKVNDKLKKLEAIIDGKVEHPHKPTKG